MNPIIYIFLNKGLHMSVGKAAAQAAHAMAISMVNSSPKLQKEWQDAIHKTVIVLEARDEGHMRNIRDYLSQRNIALAYVIDEGVNEIDPHVYTAMSTPVLPKDDEDVRAAMSTFKLYRDAVKVSLELDR